MKKMLVIVILVATSFLISNGPMNAGEILRDEEITFEEISQMPGAIVVSEYDMLKKIQCSPERYQEVIDQGMTREELSTVIDGTFSRYIAQMASLSNEELASRGLTNREVQILRTSDKLSDSVELERILQKASARVAIGFGQGNYYYDGYTANCNFYWHWDSFPVQKWRDVVAIAFGSFFQGNNATTGVVYYSTFNGQESYTQRLGGSNIRFEGDGVTFEFPMFVNMKYWATGGKAFVSMNNYSNANIRDFYVRGKYGHSLVRLTSFGVSISGTSISFSKDVKDMGQVSLLIRKTN